MPSDVMAALIRHAFFEIQSASARPLARTEPSLQHEPPALGLVPAPAGEGSR